MKLSIIFCIYSNIPASWSYHVLPRGDWFYGKRDRLTVLTSSGRIHGKIDPDLSNVRQFLSIPYAKPPLGDLRWESPQPLLQPHADIEATKLSPSCPQFLTTQPLNIYTQEVLEYNLQGLNRTGATTEDCLTASVYTPTISSVGYRPHRRQERLPVLIFVYGGGFWASGEDVPYDIPTQWVNRTSTHIVVTFNFRGNIFGFPSAKGLKNNNIGLLDIRLVVEWVQGNIAAFGGDPESIVLWGQSSGAYLIDYYSYVYIEDPIITGIILDSGSILFPLLGDSTGTPFDTAASQVGCGGSGNDTDAQMACMRRLPAATIEKGLEDLYNAGNPNLAFAPVIDDKYVFSNYSERALSGQLANVPALLGTNAQDGVPFAPYDPAGPNQTISDYDTLFIFLCPVTEDIRIRQQAGRLTYSYRYAGNFTNISPKPWLGAYHASELPLIMGTHPNFRGPSSDLEIETSHAMQDAWVSFAADPVDGLRALNWEPYARLGEASVREFGAGTAFRDISIADLEAKCNGAAPKDLVSTDIGM